MTHARPRVLIVEDDPDLRRMIAAALEDGGFESVVAPDGEEGLRRAAEMRTAAAVVDLNLPGMTGAELAWRLMQLAPETHVVALSAYLSMWDADDLRDLGIARAIPKPFDAERLVSALREGLASEERNDA